jgi:GTP-binding protein
MFIDYTKIKVRSGKGGDGMATFRREKYVPKGGPDGGDGGRGGHVYIEADKNLNTLIDFHYRQIFNANDGGKGGTSNRHGRNGEDLVIKVPLGTLIRDAKTKNIIKDLVHHGDKINVVGGGRGGRGNARFTTATHQAPRFYEKGEPGDEKDLILELKILADVGIIGLANAGKSTLLSKISNAHPKIADYPFTTLTPMLGIVKYSDTYSFVLADMPGLIEGASAGKGLGIEFLRHIERIKVYIHLIDGTQEEPLASYNIVNKELKTYNKKLIDKPQIVVINKADLLSEAEKKKISTQFKKKKIDVLFVSAKEKIGLSNVMNKVYNILKDLPPDVAEEKPDAVFEPPERMSLEKIKTGVFRLAGKQVEKYVAMLDFKNLETIEVFRKYIKKSGIEAYLKENGVQEGDIVVIGDKDFVYEE